jgi:hypothetical protein
VLSYDGYKETLEKRRLTDPYGRQIQYNAITDALIATLSSLSDQNRLNQLAQIMLKSGVLKSADQPLSKIISQ